MWGMQGMHPGCISKKHALCMGSAELQHTPMSASKKACVNKHPTLATAVLLAALQGSKMDTLPGVNAPTLSCAEHHASACCLQWSHTTDMTYAHHADVAA